MLSCANWKCSSQSKASYQDTVELLCKCYGAKKFLVRKSNGVAKEQDNLVRKYPWGDEYEKDG